MVFINRYKITFSQNFSPQTDHKQKQAFASFVFLENVRAEIQAWKKISQYKSKT